MTLITTAYRDHGKSNCAKTCRPKESGSTKWTRDENLDPNELRNPKKAKHPTVEFEMTEEETYEGKLLQLEEELEIKPCKTKVATLMQDTFAKRMDM